MSSRPSFRLTATLTLLLWSSFSFLGLSFLNPDNLFSGFSIVVFLYILVVGVRPPPLCSSCRFLVLIKITLAGWFYWRPSVGFSFRVRSGWLSCRFFFYYLFWYHNYVCLMGCTPLIFSLLIRVALSLLVLMFLFRLPSIFNLLLQVLLFAPFVGPVYGLFCFLYGVFSLMGFSLYFSGGGTRWKKEFWETITDVLLLSFLKLKMLYSRLLPTT